MNCDDHVIYYTLLIIALPYILYDRIHKPMKGGGMTPAWPTASTPPTSIEPESYDFFKINNV